jgi:RNA polymerase sigma-70 factor (ECF subfamily)
MKENAITGNSNLLKIVEWPGLPAVPDETVARFNRNDEDSFTRVYHKLYPFTFFFARKFVGPEDAADIVASVFARLWERKKAFTSLSHIKAFLFVSTRNACFGHLRNESSRIRKEAGWQYSMLEQEEVQAFSKEYAGAEKLELICREIEKLPSRCKKVFKMAYLDNLKNDEIARKLRITVSTVKNQKCHALKVLRMVL